MLNYNFNNYIIMNKKYIFNTEAKAEEMILSLATANEETPNFRKVHVTDTTKGIVVLGFQDKGEILMKILRLML